MKYILNAEALDLINKISSNFLVSPDLVCGIVGIESGWNTYKTRFEPGWKYFDYPINHSTKLGITFDTERNCQMTSWGYMQVMGGVARELGFDDYLVRLCEPQYGIYYGIKKLAKLHLIYKSISDIISAYNQGSPRKNPEGAYENQNYVNKVLIEMTKFRQGP